jgi:hypothetical protein
MDTPLAILITAVILGLALAAIVALLYEYRLRQPDVLLLYEQDGQIAARRGRFYPRHFSLPLPRTAHPLQVNVQAAAAGNLGVNVKLVGSVAAAPDHLPALIRTGGWNPEVVSRAAAEVALLLDSLVKSYAESAEIHALSTAGLLAYVEAHAEQFPTRFGVTLISLAVQSLEPADAAIRDALRQQEQARLLEQTERLHHQARVAAAKARFQADEEIAQLDHALELKQAERQRALRAEQAALAAQQVADELAHSRLRLAFEKEELAILKDNPELLILTPQAARLAEASQGLKNARTVISLTPQELAPGAELFGLFQALLQQTLASKPTDAAD